MDKEITPGRAYRLLRELVYEFPNERFNTIILESPIEFLENNTVVCGIALTPIFECNKRKLVFFTKDNRKLTKKDFVNKQDFVTIYNEILRTIRNNWEPKSMKLPDILEEHISDPFGE
jgi:hypothetical protein